MRGERKEEMSWGLRRRGWATKVPPGGCEQVGRPPVCLGLSRVNHEQSQKLGWPVSRFRRLVDGGEGSAGLNYLYHGLKIPGMINEKNYENKTPTPMSSYMVIHIPHEPSHICVHLL